MHQQPVFGGAEMFGGTIADEAFARGVCLPSGSSMSDDDLERVVDAATAALS
jgi:dTDP-4-amino-4,6-dideoxygalactose transaminase